jgi:hypothetical protein
VKLFWRILAIIAAGVAHVLIQAGPLFARSDFAWNSFRAYFPGDQLSYMSMVVNASQGRWSAVEPFTETGVNNYPHLYYLLLGIGARVTGIGPLQAWSAGGLFVQFAFICILATVLVLLCKRAWVALLAPLPFMFGTFAFLFSPTGWFIGLDSHAVLWGSFATLFTLNGEVFSLCVGGVGLLMLLLAAVWAKQFWARIVLAAVGSLLIGLLANIQTYSFFVVVFVASYVVAVYGLATTKRRWVWSSISAALVGVLFLIGPLVAHDAGPLVTLVLGLAPALPGLIIMVVRTRGILVGFVALAIAGAAPQLIGTALGIVGHDPFLTYRVASSKNLGVGPIGLIGSLALSLPLLGILVAGVYRRSRLWIAYSAGVLVSWVLMSSNDVWGANQEPYRFWLDTFVVVCMTILPFAALVLRTLLSGAHRDKAGPAPLPGTQGFAAATVSGAARGESRAAAAEENPPRPLGRRGLIVTTCALALCVVVALGSMIDFVRFSGDPAYHGLWNYNDGRYRAIATLSQEHAPSAGKMFITDPCIDALAFKIVSGLPEAYYNAGMAWPSRQKAVQRAMDDRANGVFDAGDAKAAGITRVVTDSACTPNWKAKYGSSSLSLLGTAPYSVNGTDETVSVWEVR